MSTDLDQVSLEVANLKASIFNIEEKNEKLYEQILENRVRLNSLTAYNEMLMRGDHKIFKIFGIFVTIATVMLAVVGGLSYKANTDTYASLKERIDSSLKANEIESGEVRVAHDSDIIKGYISYQRDNKDELQTFNITFSLPFLIDVNGNGTNKFIGLKIRFEDDIAGLFSTNSGGDRNSETYERIINGIHWTLNSPINMVQGLEYEYTPTYFFHRLNCAQVKAAISSVKNKTYIIHVTPYFDYLKTPSSEKQMRITFHEDSLYQCS